MKISYKLTEQDYIDFNIYHMNTSETLKKSILIQRLIGPLLFLIGIFVVNKISDIPLWYWSGIFIITGLLWFIFYPKRIEKRFRKQVLKMLSEGQNKDLFTESTLSVNEDGIIHLNSYKEINIKWNTVNRIEITAHHIFIYDSAISAIIIPLSAFSTKDEEEKFIELIKGCYREKN